MTGRFLGGPCYEPWKQKGQVNKHMMFMSLHGFLEPKIAHHRFTRTRIYNSSTVSSSSVAWDMLTHCDLTYINQDDFVSMVQGFGRGPGKCLYTMRHTQGLNPQDDCITSPVFALFTIGSEIHPLLTTGLWFFKQVRVLLRSAFDVLRSATISFIKKTLILGLSWTSLQRHVPHWQHVSII